MGNTLILVDGMSVLYRSFYAIRDLSTKSGRATNGVYGFVRKLGELAGLWHPTHWAVVFDGGRPEERLELLPEYKANRRPMPDSLRDQVGMAEAYLDAACIAWTRQEGQEADDVLASVAAWAEPDADAVLIATSDKDMYQLVNETVGVIAVAGKGGRMGSGEVESKTGVSPSRIVDWLALVGDSSDNIPGVPGVGAKTAAKLLRQYSDVAGLFAHLDEIETANLRAALERSRDVVSRNVEMVKLNRGLTVPFTWDALSVKPPDVERLLPLFEELEFSSMAADLREQRLFPD